jgi:CubicO group peptidase (beta-lactamase class C family)
MKRVWGSVFCISLILSASTIVHAAEDSLLFDVPRLDGITVDGAAGDWNDSGFRVAVLTDTQGVQKHPADFDASFRLGWDEQGLLVLLKVTDNVFVEHDDPAMIWLWDSVELFLAEEVREDADYFQAAIGPGVADSQPALRQKVYDLRVDRDDTELTIEAARSVIDGGYLLEARLPWANLGFSPTTGDVVGFQVFVNDVDEKATDFAGRFQLQWYSRWTQHGSEWMHKVRLADAPSPATLVTARGAYYDRGATRLFAAADPSLEGASLAVYDGDREIGSQKLTSVRERCQAEIVLPTPPRGQVYPALDLRVDGKSVGASHVRTENKTAEDMVFFDTLAFESYCFTSSTFPRCDFRYPRQARDVLGSYQIRTTFYDNNYNEVGHADHVGRYGAVVEVIPEEGATIRRNVTLVRVPVEIEEFWAQTIQDPQANLLFPKAYGIDAETARASQQIIGLHLQNLLLNSLRDDPETAILLAQLYDGPTAAFPTPLDGQLYYGNRAWWNTLLRKLQGQGEATLTTPRAIEGPAAPTLHEGTPAEAGFAPDTAERLDALCQEWVEAADEGMAFLVARNGIIVFQRAYGESDGTPVTLESPLYLASTTKTFAGTGMMMLVDQGLVDLTAPISDYLPLLKGTAYDDEPVSVRSLYTHTHGIPRIELDCSAANDAERAFDVASSITPHRQHFYCSVGYFVGPRITENVSGKCLAEYYHDHLLAPLGMKNTLLAWDSPGYMASSTPYDLALLAQMLLNGGAYGDQRFMRPETVELMRPTKLDWVDGPDNAKEWGIGVTTFADLDAGQFSASTYGHDGSSGSLLRIDPENNLVVTGVRSKPAGISDVYRGKFFTLIRECLNDPAPLVEKPHQR